MNVQVADYEDALLNGADKENQDEELDLDGILQVEEEREHEDFIEDYESNMYQDVERNL